MSRFLTYLLVFLSAFCSVRLDAQCANDNVLAGDLTPASVSVPVSLALQGGSYVTTTVCAGASYTFSTCGDVDFDTQITLYNNTGGASLGYNDDGCGVQSTITWIAAFTGTLRVLVDQYNCAN